MSLAIIKDNTITYNTALYRAYNIYLICEYKKYLDTIDPTFDILYKRVDNYIKNQLEQLLEDNKEDRDIEKIFNIMDWEENLVRHYKVLNMLYNSIGKKSPMSIEKFNRKLKLEKLNESDL